MPDKKEERQALLRDIVEELISELDSIARDKALSFTVTMTLQPEEGGLRPGGSGGACVCGEVCYSVQCVGPYGTVCQDQSEICTPHTLECDPKCGPHTCKQDACDGLVCDPHDCGTIACKGLKPTEKNVALGNQDVQEKLKSEIERGKEKS